MTKRLAELFASVFIVIVAAVMLLLMLMGFFAIQDGVTVVFMTVLGLMVMVVLVTGPIALLVQIHNYLKFMAMSAGYDSDVDGSM